MNIPEDPFVRELLPEFVDTWIEDIDAQFDDLINGKQDAELYRFGHTLKGSCFQFGLDELGNLGIELMGYAKTLNWDRAVAMKPVIRGKFMDYKNYLENNGL